MNEEWRDVVGYEGLYMVSNFGRVKSIERTRNSGTGGYVQKGRIMSANNKGYPAVTFYKGGKCKRFMIHRLVACTFIPTSNKKLVVNHIDGNRKNNHVDNLEWCTQKQNIAHAISIGIGTIGERNGLSKFTNDEVRELRKMYVPYDPEFGASALARKHGVPLKTMWFILTRRTYKSVV